MRYSNITRARRALGSVQLGALGLVATLVGAIMLVGCAANNGSSGGTGYRYTCSDGTPDSGDASADGIERCASCNSGRYRTLSNRCVTSPVVRACGHFTSSTARTANSGPGNSNSNGGPKGIAIRVIDSSNATWGPSQNRIYCLNVARSGSAGAADLAYAMVQAIAVEATHDGHPLNGANVSTVSSNPIRFKITANTNNAFQVTLLSDNLGEVFQSRGSVVFTPRNCTADCNGSVARNPTTLAIADGSADASDNFGSIVTITSEFEITVNGFK